MPLPLRALALFLFSILPLKAQFGDDSSGKSEATLVAEVSSISPASNFTLALHLVHPQGWHSYYRNSGGIELPPEIQWTLPEGFTAGPIQWPVPKVKKGEYGTSFIYPEKVTLLVDITAPDNLEPGSTATLKADAQWQICDTGCINEEGTFELNLAVGETATLSSGSEEFFRQARDQIPSVADNWTFTTKQAKDRVLLILDPENSLQQLPTDFIPDQAYLNAASLGGSIQRDGETIRITVPRKTVDGFGDPIEQGDKISGIIVGTGQSVLVPLTPIGVDDTPPETRDSTDAPAAVGFVRLTYILGGMFLGGLILNLMPCVFPVIGLKIMGFVQQAGEDKKKVILHGITFTLGVVISFAVLSGLLFAFKESFGWGDQLGEPWFVMPIMILMFLLGMNMFGVFELGTSATSVGGNLQAKSGLAGSFFSGSLATLIATPCSGPFLGTAIGATIALPAAQFFSAFGAMAIGLSAPYLVLSMFPKLVESLPRPGAWMESFKQAMSFLLFATAGFLLWVYTDLVAMQDMAWPYPIFGLSMIAVAAWIHGRWNLPSREKRTRRIALAFIALFAGGGLILSMPPAADDSSDSSELTLTWETWSPDKVEDLLAEGRPVYIDFTAKWCATCRLNKGRAYSQEVIKLMDEKGVTALKADKTRPNPDIETAIRKYGRAAIPVNVLLIPGKEPIILPELLSPDDVIEALEQVE